MVVVVVIVVGVVVMVDAVVVVAVEAVVVVLTDVHIGSNGRSSVAVSSVHGVDAVHRAVVHQYFATTRLPTSKFT